MKPMKPIEVEKFTDDETITLDTVRKHPCISECGGCHIVSRHTMFGDGGHIAVTDKAGVNAFAAAAGAYGWVGSVSSRRDGSRPVQKRAYGVRLHDID